MSFLVNIFSFEKRFCSLFYFKLKETSWIKYQASLEFYFKIHNQALSATTYDDSPNKNQALITNSKQAESTIPKSQDGEGHSEPKPGGWDGKPIFLIIIYQIYKKYISWHVYSDLT